MTLNIITGSTIEARLAGRLARQWKFWKENFSFVGHKTHNWLVIIAISPNWCCCWVSGGTVGVFYSVSRLFHIFKENPGRSCGSRGTLFDMRKQVQEIEVVALWMRIQVKGTKIYYNIKSEPETLKAASLLKQQAPATGNGRQWWIKLQRVHSP